MSSHRQSPRLPRALRLRSPRRSRIMWSSWYAASAKILGLSLTRPQVRRFVGLEQSMVAIERIKEFTEVKREPAEFIEPRPPTEWPTKGEIKCEDLVIRYAVRICDIVLAYRDADYHRHTARPARRPPQSLLRNPPRREDWRPWAHRLGQEHAGFVLLPLRRTHGGSYHH